MNYTRKSSNKAVLIECKIFLGIAYTSYDNSDELFQNLIVKCQQLDSTASQVISKFKAVASEATQRLQYRAIIKVIWRYIRDMSVNPDHRLFLMVLAFSALTVGARKATKNADDVDKWRNEIAAWLGQQLATTRKGENGSKHHKLFKTAYLNNFD